MARTPLRSLSCSGASTILDRMMSGRWFRPCLLALAAASALPSACKSGRLPHCDKEASSVNVNLCYQREAERRGDPKLCEFVEGSAARDRCFGGLPSRVKDERSCSRIEQRTEADKCYKSVAVFSKQASTLRTCHIRYPTRRMLQGFGKIHPIAEFVRAHLAFDNPG
jgi:hypothetical protein